MRTVTIYSTVGELDVTHQSSARTWGELKSELDAMNFDDKIIAILETETMLVSSSNVLPGGDFTLVITPTKNKAGSTTLSYKELVAIAKIRGYSNIELLDEDQLRHLVEYGSNGVFPILSTMHNLNEKLAGIRAIKNDIVEQLEQLIGEIEDVFDEVTAGTETTSQDVSSLKERVNAFINKLP